MEQVRRDTIHEWSGGTTTIGPFPRNLNSLVNLNSRNLNRPFSSQSFTHRDNLHGNTNPNIAFQRDLDKLLEAYEEYRDSPSLPQLCHLLAELVHRWEKLEMQSRRMSGSTSNHSSADKGKHSSSDRGRPCKVLIAWDAIDPDINARIVLSGLIQTLIIVDDGRDARQIGSCEPEARRTGTLSSLGRGN
jgi:hypothetical protein